MSDNDLLRVVSPDSGSYRTAFEFKVREVEHFVAQILSIKRDVEAQFVDTEYSDAVLIKLAEFVEPRCDEAAFNFDAALSAVFSALDCFARAHSKIAKGAKKSNGKPFRMRDISFSIWVRKLRKILSELKAEGNAPEIVSNLEKVLDIDGERFNRLRRMRNFYTHERHPLQDCDAGSVSTIDGRISGVSLPLAWHKTGEVDFIDVSASEAREDLKLLHECSNALGDWAMLFD